MHEQAIIKSVIDSIRQNLSSQKLTGKVRTISLKIGAMELHGEESFKQIFAVAAAGTQLEGARLELTVIPARIKCKCGHEGPAGEDVDHHCDMPIAECPKCGEVCRVNGGRGVDGIDLEVEEVSAKKP